MHVIRSRTHRALWAGTCSPRHSTVLGAVRLGADCMLLLGEGDSYQAIGTTCLNKAVGKSRCHPQVK